MLKTYHTITDLQQILFLEKQKNQSIGFVPTMGALHAGHLSLIETSNASSAKTVCSIFVNPTQFNDAQDYKKYPRDIEKDIELLESAGCDFLFLPDEKEMYPDNKFKSIDFDPGELGLRLEGASRPGHFAGMTAVVKRLFDIVLPDKAFFGQKDYQQYLIVKKMVDYYHLPIEIIKCPIHREPNGLAMSSRNERLAPELRQEAALIHKTLTWIKEQVNRNGLNFEVIKSSARAMLESNGNFTVDYIDICSALDLKPATEDTKNLIALAAVNIGGVRLIDNVEISKGI